MVRALLTVAVVAAAAALAPHAHAQQPQLTPEQIHAEQSTIDAESSGATILYGIGIPLHLLGFPTALAGALAGSGGSVDTAVALALVGLIGAGLGLVMIIVAIGLDIASGARRGKLHRRMGFTAELSPLGIAGTFD